MSNYFNLSEEKQKEIVQAIIGYTKFENRTWDFTGTEIGKMLEDVGLAPNRVYISITPSIRFRLLDYPNGHDIYIIDLKEFREGDPTCDHKLIQLYWEEGGGGMDSGSQNYYTLCFKCGFSPVTPGVIDILSKMPGLSFLKRFTSENKS